MLNKIVIVILILLIIGGIVVLIGMPKKCKPGTFGSNGKTDWFSDSCEVCPSGTFSDSDGNENCSLCPAGTYSDEGAIVCEDKCSNIFVNTPKSYEDIMGDDWLGSCKGEGNTQVNCNTVRADKMSESCFNQLWKDGGCPDKSGTGYGSAWYTTTPQYQGCPFKADGKTVDDGCSLDQGNNRVICTTENAIVNLLSPTWSTQSCVVDKITKYGAGNILSSLELLRTRINQDQDKDGYCRGS